MTNIYVGNLSFKTTSNDLEKTFSEFGEVTRAQVVQDRERGQSKGFGFVEMANEDDAQNAIRSLDGQELQGRNLKVNIARPREERPRKW
ncbi:MAG: RNA-binding protein [Planctomycetaceae bacterium]